MGAIFDVLYEFGMWVVMGVTRILPVVRPVFSIANANLRAARCTNTVVPPTSQASR